MNIPQASIATRIVAVLAKTTEPQSAKALAHSLDTRVDTVWRQLRRLDKAGVVERSQSNRGWKLRSPAPAPEKSGHFSRVLPASVSV